MNEQLKKELSIDKSRLDEEFANNPLYTQKYLDLYYKYLRELNDVQIEFDELQSKRIKYFKTEHNLIPENLSELKLLLNGDEELIPLRKKLNDINIKISYYKDVVDQFKNKMWDMKGINDFLKFTSGNAL